MYDLEEVVEVVKEKSRPPKTDDEIADEVSDMLARNPMLSTVDIDTKKKGGEA